jgi:hypothetical protein
LGEAMTDATIQNHSEISNSQENGAIFRAASQFVDLLEKTEKLSNRPSTSLLIQIGLGLLVIVIVARLLPFSKYLVQDFVGFDFLVTFVVAIIVVIIGASLRFYDVMLSERRLEKIIDFQLEILRIERGISEATAKQTYQDQKNTISNLLTSLMGNQKTA